MNDWALAVRKLDEIVKQTAIAATEGERAGLYAGARLLLSDLHGFVANEAGGNTYALEKIGSAKWHIGAALGFDIDNGHPAEQHRAWAYGALQSLKSTLDKTVADD
ncbi:hypothetical protein [Bradyrhizobium sp. 2S1]|uniref:hypothetical protein n=1 Tax=Bradyrhizobium sp. 2S1 TaxID=1404429 RepID=UPI00140816A2|nr:hypothetical protein [Bradyrhizobium sp. 2S1]MCK7669188.1 hypothetical protein [Bradyrhizobium sp. 2S1]